VSDPTSIATFVEAGVFNRVPDALSVLSLSRLDSSPSRRYRGGERKADVKQERAQEKRKQCVSQDETRHAGKDWRCGALGAASRVFCRGRGEVGRPLAFAEATEGALQIGEIGRPPLLDVGRALLPLRRFGPPSHCQTSAIGCAGNTIEFLCCMLCGRDAFVIDVLPDRVCV
jgi:hypothetical protein